MLLRHSQSTYVFEGGVGSGTGSCFFQELIPVEVCILNAGALICSKEKKKKNNKKKKEKKEKIERKESSLQHSQRRQKLCQRVWGENSNRYKRQHKETQKVCLKVCA